MTPLGPLQASSDDQLPRLWIGGTGRCGTSLLYRLLRAHPKVHAFRREMRFIVDPGGLFDLVHALTESFSTARAREAWRTFRVLLLDTLDSPRTPPYAGFQFSELLGSDYPRIVEEYLTALLWGTYRGHDVQTRIHPARHLAGRIGRSLNRRHVMPNRAYAWLLDVEKTEQQVVRHYGDRGELMSLTGRFIDSLFSSAMTQHGKTTWCEKTPHNFLFADFLQALVPNSLFIHVFRDPRGVAQSFARQTWSSPDLRTSCRTVRDLYERWFVVRERTDASRLIEIRLEALAEHALDQYNVLLARADLDPVHALPEVVSLPRVDYWRRSVSRHDLAIMNDELGTVVERMGFRV